MTLQVKLWAAQVAAYPNSVTITDEEAITALAHDRSPLYTSAETARYMVMRHRTLHPLGIFYRCGPGYIHIGLRYGVEPYEYVAF